MALTFGDSERIELPSAQTLLNADVFSICFWFRAGSTETNNRLILDEDGSQFDRQLQIMVKASDAGSGPNALQYVYRADNFNTIQSNSAVTDDTWRRALIRRTGTSSDHEMFLDTVSQGTVSGTGTNSGESPTIWLGNNTGFTTQSFNENLAHFAAWVGTELTLQQAETFLWTGRWTDRPTYYIPMRSASPRDLSGNGVSLTVSGSPAVADHAPIPAMERLSSGLLVPASTGQTESMTASLDGTSTDSVGEVMLNVIQSSTLAGTSTDSAAPQTTDALGASLVGTSTDSATPSVQDALSAQLAGTSTDSADPLATAALVATLDGLSTDSASPTVSDALAATLAGTSVDSGTITLGGVELLVATLSGTSSDSGAVAKAVDLSSTLPGTSSDTASVVKLVDLVASLDGVSTDSGAVQATAALVASLAGTSTDTATATLTDRLVATLAGTSTDSGAISLGDLTLLTATLSGTSTDSAVPSVSDALVADLAGTSLDSASARRTLGLLSTLTGVSSDSGLITLSEVGSALDSDTTALVLKHADSTTLVLMDSDSTLLDRLDEGESEWPT